MRKEGPAGRMQLDFKEKEAVRLIIQQLHGYWEIFCSTHCEGTKVVIVSILQPKF